jgi:DNA-binding MarR family transcriptional regulator
MRHRLFLLGLISVLAIPLASGLEVSSNSPVYIPGQQVLLTAHNVTANVTFQVVGPEGGTLVIEQVSPSDGNAVLVFRLPEDVKGTFMVHASGPDGHATATFRVVGVSITSPPSGGSVIVITTPHVVVIVMIFVLAGALGSAWAVEAGRWHLLGLIIPLYTKLKPEQVMSHEIRGSIYGVIVSEPGIHYSKIRTRLNLKNGTLAHHLRVLEKEGKIRSIRDGSLRRFFPRGVTPKYATVRRAPRPTQLVILSTLEEYPGITQKELARITRMSQQRISYNLKKLVDMGYVDEIEGRVKRYIVHGGPLAFTCPRCGNQFTSDRRPKFCPNCGHGMEEE